MQQNLPCTGVPITCEWSASIPSFVPMRLHSRSFFICEQRYIYIHVYILHKSSKPTCRRSGRVSPKWTFNIEMVRILGRRSISARRTGKSNTNPLWATKTALKVRNNLLWCYVIVVCMYLFTRIVKNPRFFCHVCCDSSKPEREDNRERLLTTEHCSGDTGKPGNYIVYR